MAMSEVMAGADEVLQGIKRNQITGIPPGNMSNFSVSKDAGKQAAVIRCTPPEDTIIDGQLICTVKGVRIIKKIGAAPILPNDGVLIADVPAGEQFEYIDLDITEDKKYFYGFFPYSDHGVYNYNSFNILQINGGKTFVFGFRQDFSDKDPSTTITYLEDCDNFGYRPMHTNEGTGDVTSGDWLPFLTRILKNHPFMVKKTGEADYQINADDYTQRAAGGTSDYNNLNYDGGAFAWLNKIWMNEIYAEDGESREVRFRNAPADGFFPVGFYDPDENELEGVWIPMGYMDASGRTLIAGTTPCANKTCDQEKALIDGFSSRAVFLGGPIMNVLRDLEYMLFKTTDIQAAAGHGRCNAGANAVINNAVVANGSIPGWKGTSDKRTMNKYFHSQVLGSYQQWIRDPYTITIAGKGKMSAYYEYDLTGAKYIDTGITLSTNSAWWYASHLISCGDPRLGSQPKQENTGTTATGLCDGGPYGNNAGACVSLRLGSCVHDLIAGPAALYLYYEASLADWNYGVGLLLLPPPGYTPEMED